MITIIENFGYIGILILIAVENIFPPIPSEVILTFSGFMTNYSSLNIFLVILFSSIGSIIGAIVLYYIGSLLNNYRLNNFFSNKSVKKLGFNISDINKSNVWFNRYGNITVLVCRFIPIIRSLISIPAGMSRMNMFSFLLFTFIGSSIWNTVLVVLGSVFGKNWGNISLFISNYSKIIIIILVILFTHYCFKKIQK